MLLRRVPYWRWKGVCAGGVLTRRGRGQRCAWCRTRRLSLKSSRGSTTRSLSLFLSLARSLSLFLSLALSLSLSLFLSLFVCLRLSASLHWRVCTHTRNTRTRTHAACTPACTGADTRCARVAVRSHVREARVRALVCRRGHGGRRVLRGTLLAPYPSPVLHRVEPYPSAAFSTIPELSTPPYASSPS